MDEGDPRLAFLDDVFPLATSSGGAISWIDYVHAYEYSFTVTETPRLSFQPRELIDGDASAFATKSVLCIYTGSASRTLESRCLAFRQLPTFSLSLLYMFHIFIALQDEN